MKRKTLLGSLFTIAAAASLVIGSTYALFTSEAKTNIAVTSGTVKVTAQISDVKLYSRDIEQIDTFENGGTATFADGKLTLDRITPMDKVEFNVEVKNLSDVTIQYRTLIQKGNDTGLFEALKISVDGTTFDGTEIATLWTKTSETGKLASLKVAIEMPKETSNDYQGKSCELIISVEAVQGNATVTNPDRIVIASLEQFVAFRDEVNAGNSFAGKTIILTTDLDLDEYENWKPIGTTTAPFKGIFEGNGHTISNLKVLAENGEYAGLFGYVHATTVRNFTIDGATIVSKDRKGVGTAAAVAHTFNEGTIEKITVKNATIEGHRKVGSVYGEGYGDIIGCRAENITITVVPNVAQPEDYINEEWPYDYDNGDKVGGIAGFVREGNYTIANNSVENVSIKGYRDLGGIVGYTYSNVKTTDNYAKDVTIVADQETGYYETKPYNAGPIVGVGSVDETNTYDNFLLFKVKEDKLDSGSNIQQAIDNHQSTIILEAGEYAPFSAYQKNNTVTVLGAVDENGAPATTIVSNGGEFTNIAATKASFKNVRFEAAEGSKPKPSLTNFFALVYGQDGASGKTVDFYFENCIFDTSKAADGCGAIHFSSGVGTFKNCSFIGGGQSYSAFYYCCPKGDITVEGCTFSGYTFASIHVAEGTCENLVVKNCEFAEDAGSIELGSPVNVLFEGNTFKYGDKEDIAINLWGPNMTTFINNKFAPNAKVKNRGYGAAIVDQKGNTDLDGNAIVL